ncbi:response regulator [Bacteroidales bacterium]|nr:response regulator [Bacteroidales bacterium]
MKKVIVILLLFFFGSQGFTRQSEYKFHRVGISDGLANNQINYIFQDSHGFIWISTASGLDRFDGVNFKHYKYNSDKSVSFIEDKITSIQEDSNNNLWLNNSNGYILFDLNNEVFKPIPDNFKNKKIEKVYIDKDKNIWFNTYVNRRYLLYNPDKGPLDVLNSEFEAPYFKTDFVHSGKYYYIIHEHGLLECYNAANYSLEYIDSSLCQLLKDTTSKKKVFIDSQEDIWVYRYNIGLYRYNNRDKRWRHYSVESNNQQLTSNLIAGVEEDMDGQIWIATDHGGINIINKIDDRITILNNNRYNPFSIPQNSVKQIFTDNQGIVWVTTYKKGIAYFHHDINKFNHVYNEVDIKNSLPYNDVDCFAEDQHGNLWLGTNGGGLIYQNRKTNTFTSYQHDPNNKNSLSNDIAISLLIDDEGLVWVGTFTGGLNVYNGKNFKRFNTEKDKKNGFVSDDIWCIAQDIDQKIWIGTLGSGIIVHDKNTGRFTKPENHGDINLPSPYINSFEESGNGDIIISTTEGVVKYNYRKKAYETFRLPEENHDFLLTKNINESYCDSRGMYWFATNEGLLLFDPTGNYIKHFSQEDDLPRDIIYGILEDEFNSIWVSKSTGLSRIKLASVNPESGYNFIINNYTKSDGLQGTEFNLNSRLKTKSGELIFGGANGYNIFNAGEIASSSSSPKVEFTDFRIFNKSVGVGEKVDGKIILPTSLQNIKQIKLKYSANVFSIEFIALNYLVPEKVKYKYKLEGFDKEWIYTDNNHRKITYTNLNPGAYKFLVKASNNNGVWHDDSTQLIIEILPPFYATYGAYALYVMIFMVGIFYFRQWFLRKQKAKFDIEQERLQKIRNKELDEMKFRFLTNVSHEFRTPLTLIQSPLETLIKTAKSSSNIKLLNIIQRNSEQLLGLVNQLLDFRKLDLHGLKFNPSYGDIVNFIKEVCDNFSEGFQKKNVRFVFKTSVNKLFFKYDAEKIEKIVMNLLSNALKFTPKGGEVCLSIDFGEMNASNSLVISVADDGIGIDPHEHDKIFERFYQSKNSEKQNISGSGIGLNLTREMVQLHNGNIYVQSNLNQGARFVVEIPISEEKSTFRPVAQLAGNQENASEGNAGYEQGEDIPTILVVEDNTDFRNFICDTLSEKYKVIDASDGKTALEMVHDKLPDLIISDIMMPDLDGLEMSKQLKADKRTSHIPIILLTARTADEDKIKGLETGVDDYITKPFKMDLLMIRIQNLLDKKMQNQKQFQKKFEVNPSEIEISSLDEELLQKALVLADKNIAEPEFSVEEFSKELGMSRVHLYKKLKALTGKTPIEFIRILRLKRGEQLLRKSQLSVSEIAYGVGFNNPRYFSKYFKEEFGMLPTDYVKKYGE